MPNHPIIKEIEDGEIGEYSAVDEPATDIDFLMFKSVKGDDFRGLGSGAPGKPETGGRSRELDVLRRCIENNPDLDPAVCEAIAAGQGLDAALRADMVGDDAMVSDPVTAGDFDSTGTKFEGMTEEEFAALLDPVAQQILAELDAHDMKVGDEECMRALMADPKFSGCGSCGRGGKPLGRGDRAAAICYGRNRGLGKTGEEKPTMTRRVKEEPPLNLPIEAVEAAPEMPEAEAEIETTAVEWAFEDCVRDAKEQLEVADEGAIKVCSIIKTDYGDLENEGQILIPEGMDQAALMRAAAIQAGIIKIGRGAGGEEAGEGEPEKRFKFRGSNRWWEHFRNRLNLNREKTPQEKAQERLRERMQAVETGMKSKDDTIRLLMAQNRMYARQLGFDVSALDGLGGDAVAAAPAPAPAEGAETGAAIGTVDGGDEGKRGRKDEAAAAVADPPATETDEEKMARLEAENARYHEIFSAGAVMAGVPVAGEATEEQQVSDILPVMPGTPAAAVASGLLVSEQPAPPEGVVLMNAQPAAALAVPGKRTKTPGQRKSIAPTGLPTQSVRVVKSTILGGAYIPAEDRTALGWDER